MKVVFAIVMLAIVMLCATTLAQEEATESWFKNGQELYKNESYQEALNAYDQVLKIDPQNASAWHYRGLALAGMGHGVEANRSIQKALDLFDQRLRDDPEDLEALWLRAEEMDLLGRSEEALDAYGRVADLNSSHALGAMIRGSDILAALGRYNQSVESFSRAMALVPANRSQSQLEFHRQRENTFIFTKAWLINGQILRVSIGLYNISSKSFDEIEQINSDFVAALQLKGSAADPGRHGGSLIGSSLNWDVYSFNIPKTMGPAGPPIMAITRINPTGDEFIEVTNGLKEAISLQNWSLEIQGSGVSLPEHPLLSGKTVRIHLGSGQENETDLFLDSNLELNDTVGSISLRDESGEGVASLDYSTKLDGSIAYSITAKGNFEYPEPGNQEKMVQKTAGEGPFVAERVEIGPESAHSNRDVPQENTAEYWSKKGQELMMNGSLDEALGALDNATMLDPRNADAWRYKALALRDLHRFNESTEAFDRALELNPQDTQARTEMAGLLMVMGRSSEAAAVLDTATGQASESPEERLWQSSAWRSKGNILAEKGSYEEALKAYDRAIELGSGQPLGSATAWLNKGHLLMRLERYEDALLAYDNALESDYDNTGKSRPTLVGSEAWLGKGKALDALGRHNEAVEAYNRSVEALEIDLSITPEAAKLWKEKADALEGMGRHEEAASAYERAVQIFRKDIETSPEQSNGWRYWWIGDALQTLGQTDEADAAFAKAKELGYQG